MTISKTVTAWYDSLRAAMSDRKADEVEPGILGRDPVAPRPAGPPKKEIQRRGTNMQVIVHWRSFEGDEDSGRAALWPFFAYVTPDCEEILYIGKANRELSWRYSNGSRGRNPLFRELEEKRGIRQVELLSGTVRLPPGTQMTRELLADIEAMLIYEFQPWGNVTDCRSLREFYRPDIRVRCTWDWPAQLVAGNPEPAYVM